MIKKTSSASMRKSIVAIALIACIGTVAFLAREITPPIQQIEKPLAPANTPPTPSATPSTSQAPAAQ